MTASNSNAGTSTPRTESARCTGAGHCAPSESAVLNEAGSATPLAYRQQRIGPLALLHQIGDECARNRASRLHTLLCQKHQKAGASTSSPNTATGVLGKLEMTRVRDRRSKQQSQQYNGRGPWFDLHVLIVSKRKAGVNA